MKAFPVSDLQAGRYFTKAVYLDDKYILLTPETQLTDSLLERLRAWEYATVLSDGESVTNPVLSSDDDGASVSLSVDQDVKEQTLFHEAETFFNELLGFVERIFTDFVTKGEIAQRPIGDQVKRVIDMTRSHRRYLLRLGEMTVKDKNYIVNHSTKTAVVSIAIGTTLRLPSHKLIELGTAAMLHEIGMIRLPPQLYMSQKQLSGKERQAIAAHTVLGFKILKQESFPVSVSLAVLECRENHDGTGYPRKLAGDKISLYAKIIRVAGSFAAMISERPFRAALEGHAAILEMLQQSGKHYDESVLKALIANVSLYPIGTYVQLSNGTRGMVVDTNVDNPRAPKVRVIAGPQGERYAEQPVVDTGIDTTHTVVRAIASPVAKN